MYPAKFDYVRAGSVQEALTLASQNEDSKFIAGGHSLLPLMKLRLASPGTLIDIGRIAELKGITSENGGVTIGSLTTHDEIAHSDAVKSTAPALSDAAHHVGDQQVRNRGTIGGNIAHADPASDLPTVLVGLGAEVRIQSASGTRTVPAADFFLDILTSDLQPGEIITSIHIPAAPKSAYIKFENPASGSAMVGVCASVGAGGTNVAIGGALPKPFLLSGITSAEATSAAIAGIEDWMGDIHASADYRKAVAPTFVERALAAANSR